MRVDILAIGSRGDVQPYVALGHGLLVAGYRVRLVTLGGFEELVRSHNLEHLVIADSPQKIASTTSGQEWVRKRSSTTGYLRGFIGVANSLIEDGIANYWKVCGTIDAMIVSPMGQLFGAHIAEKLRIPMIRAHLAPPVVRTSYNWDGETSLPIMIERFLAAGVHAGFNFLIWNKLRAAANVARRKILDLPPLSITAPFREGAQGVLFLGGFSPTIVVRPPDWADSMYVTGYWFLHNHEAWTPSQELSEFLDSGSPPVFVGFGSTPFPHPQTATDLVVRAVTRAGRRGIIVAGGSGLKLGRLHGDVLSVESVPHESLFARVSAAVHHGGAGVTGAALRAGIPSVVVPVFADQPFWGSRVYALGAGPPPIPAKLLAEEKLTSAIQATAEAPMRERAAALGEKIKREDGIGRAVEILDRHLGRRAARVLTHQNAH